jgi:PIN domain nuclease of toxin-antitoxin system
VRLLLDTHVLLWWLEGRPELPDNARDAIATGENEVIVSVASAWEIAIKSARRRLIVSGDLRSNIEASGMRVLPISFEHALAAGALPPHHNDPFDRMIIAQAMIEDLMIVTRDPRYEPYGAPILKA